MLRTKIKATAINNLTDARYFAAREVEWLGFQFGGDPETSISPMAARAIVEWVDGVKIVGEFGLATSDDIITASGSMRFDAVQVGMFTPTSELEKLQDLTIIKEVVVTSASTEGEIWGHFTEYQPFVTYFLLDFTKSGIRWEQLKTGRPLTLDFLAKLCDLHKILFALDFSPSEVEQVLESLNPAGLSLSGGGEEKIGLKSFDELDEILDNLEAGF